MWGPCSPMQSSIQMRQKSAGLGGHAYSTGSKGPQTGGATPWVSSATIGCRTLYSVVTRLTCQPCDWLHRLTALSLPAYRSPQAKELTMTCQGTVSLDDLPMWWCCSPATTPTSGQQVIKGQCPRRVIVSSSGLWAAAWIEGDGMSMEVDVATL